MNGQAVDRPPFVIPGGMMNMAVTGLMDISGIDWPDAHLDPEKMAGLSLAANRILGVENVGVPFCMTVEAEGMGAEIDLGTKVHEPSIESYPMETIYDIDRISGMDVNSGRAKVCIDAIGILKEKTSGIPVFANLTGPISLASSLIDPLIFYRTFIRNKDSAHRLMGIVNKSLMLFGDAMIEAGADVVCIADPSASGELVGKKSFDEFALHYINELVLHFREKNNVPSIVHICGRVQSLGTALSEIEAESISVDACVSLKKLQELAPSKISMGNANTYLLSEGNPDKIFRHGISCLHAGTGILAPACGISPRTPVENIKSLAEAVKKWVNDEQD